MKAIAHMPKIHCHTKASRSSRCGALTACLLALTLGSALTLTGCSAVSKATGAVSDTTRSMVSAIKRGANKTVSKASGDGATRPTPSASGGFELTGVLVVVDNTGCSQGKRCEPRYQLFNEDFTIRTGLTGNLHDVHDGLVVTVKGDWGPLSGKKLSGRGWRRLDEVIEVDDYSIHTGVRLQAFLSREASEYGRRVYDCEIRWPQAYAWRIVNREAFLIVRLTDPRVNSSGGQYVELWYRGESGEFLREANSHASINPCV